MATVELGHAPSKFAGDIAGSLGAALRVFVNKVALWNETRQTREILNRLSDRELADIGLSRGEIASLTLRTKAL